MWAALRALHHTGTELEPYPKLCFELGSDSSPQNNTKKGLFPT
jgi:hypothetical protein